MIFGYDYRLIKALRKCADENKDKHTDTCCVVVSSVCASAAERIEQLNQTVEKMKRCGNCKHRQIHGFADILDTEPKEPCSDCDDELSKWEMSE